MPGWTSTVCQQSRIQSGLLGSTEREWQYRRIRRGDESKGDPDERDVAGDYADDHPETTDPARDQGLKGRRVPS